MLHLLAFLSAVPDPERVRGLDESAYAPDLFRLHGRELHLWLPGGVQDSPLSRMDWERRLGVTVTMRNWNTVTRLRDLALGREGEAQRSAGARTPARAARVSGTAR